MISKKVRQRFIPSWPATWGIIEVSETIAQDKSLLMAQHCTPQYTDNFLFADIAQITPNPAQGPVDLTTAELRIAQIDQPQHITTIQDFRDKSVIAGLSGLGGLGSLLSTLFAVVFGVSLIQIFYRASDTLTTL